MPKPPSNEPPITAKATVNAPAVAVGEPTPARRPRGRPPKNPAAGPATPAMRAAALRQREKREIKALILCLGDAINALETRGHHGLVPFIFRAERRAALGAVQRHWPEKAAELKRQTRRCLLLDNELSQRAFGPMGPEGRTKRSILHDGKEWALTSAGVVTCDGVPTEFRVARYPRTCVVIHGTGYPNPAFRTHYHQDQLKMALLDVALLLAERGTGPGCVTLDELSTALSPIPRADSFKPRSSGEKGVA